MNNLIFTDIDGVVLSWDTHFHEYMQSHGHKKAHDEPSYWQETYYPGLSETEARKMVYHFNTSAWMLGCPPYKDARSGIARLVENGYRFIGVTAMGTDQFSLEARKINLNRLFGHDAFQDVIATDMYDPNSKRSFLSKYKDNGYFWIEDKPSNAELGSELGFDTLLMEHGYNENYVPKNKMRGVKSWADICDIILGSD